MTFRSWAIEADGIGGLSKAEQEKIVADLAVNVESHSEEDLMSCTTSSMPSIKSKWIRTYGRSLTTPLVPNIGTLTTKPTRENPLVFGH